MKSRRHCYLNPIADAGALNESGAGREWKPRLEDEHDPRMRWEFVPAVLLGLILSLHLVLFGMIAWRVWQNY